MYSASIERALRAAVSAHDRRQRSRQVPAAEAVHPLHVALMLARWGQDEDVIVAGIMRAVVAAGEGWTLERLALELGPHVAALVGELDFPAPRGRERLAHLSPQAAAIEAADELHALQGLMAELRAAPDPDAPWAGRETDCESLLALTEERVEALEHRVEPRVARALRAALEALRELSERTPKAEVGGAS